MSLLLKKSMASAAKAGARRRLPASSSNEAWFPSAERSFWHYNSKRDHYHSSARLFGTTARSLVTSWRDRDDSDTNTNDRLKQKRQLTIQCSTNGMMVNAPSFISRGSFAPTVGYGVLRAASFSATTAVNSFSQSSRGFTSGRAPGTFVRFAHPPGSIRSSIALSQLVASERSATDAALRALTTWVLSNSSSNNNNRHQDIALRFRSTNNDGSRRDLVRGGIRKTKIPMPPSGDPNERSMKPEDVMNEINTKSKTVVLPAILSGLKTALVFLLRLPKNLLFYLMNPSEVTASWKHIKKVIKDEVDHYWVGTKVRRMMNFVFCYECVCVCVCV